MAVTVNITVVLAVVPCKFAEEYMSSCLRRRC